VNEEVGLQPVKAADDGQIPHRKISEDPESSCQDVLVIMKVKRKYHEIKMKKDGVRRMC